MKNTACSLVAIVALAAMGTTPVFASSSPWYCGLPVIGQFLCPPAPGGSGGGRGGNQVPEPASIAILAAGAGIVSAAMRRRRNKH